MKKMISRILLLAMVLYLCLPIATFVYAKENIKVMVNDTYTDENAYVETLGEKLYVSARSVANPMGLNLDWNDTKKTLMISYQDKIISLIVASNLAIVDNNPIETEQPLKIMSDRAIIDLGFICNVLNATMTFNEASNTYCVTIDVPENFQPDIIKTNEVSNEAHLLNVVAPEITKVKEISDALELETIWDDSNKALTLSSELGDTLTLIVGDCFAWFNGERIECPSPLKIIDDEAYTEYEFVEKLFTIQVPQSYTPVRQIAEAINADIEWLDEIKTVEFTAKNGDKLSMSAGSCYYMINDKFYDNPAPLIVKDGIALTDQAVVSEAFSKPAASGEDESAELLAADKTFSGQLVFEKTLSTATYIDVNVISVQSIVYTNHSGTIYSDYNTKRITVPANSRTVNFSVTKTGCTLSDRYIIGYSFPSSNGYYYQKGYLSNSGGIYTSLSTYIGYYTAFNYISTTSDIVIRPKTYSYVTLDDAVFSGAIKVTNGAKFGTGSSLNVSVRSISYYGESTISSQTLYPGNTTSANFSISVPNTSSNRSRSLYLRYDLYNGDDSIISRGYYQSSTASTASSSQAKSWDITRDALNNINFVVLSKLRKTMSGTFYMPDGMIVDSNKNLSFAIDIQTVRYNVYSNKIFSLYATYDNVATITSGESSASYSLPVTLDDGELYIFRYRVTTPYHKVIPYGYVTTSSHITNPEYATIYKAASDLYGMDFWLKESESQYTYINNLPYNTDGTISSSTNVTDRGSYFAGYYIYLTKGQTVTIELKSSDFDSFLYLLDDSMSILDYDDDGLGYRNSQIVRYISESGYYYIQATTYNSGTTGSFTLNVDTNRLLSGGTSFTNTCNNAITSIGSNSLIKANYTVKNNKATPQDFQLIMALYDKNNILINIVIKDVKVIGLSTTESITMDLRGFSNIGMIKSFIWTGNKEAVGNVDYLYL